MAGIKKGIKPHRKQFQRVMREFAAGKLRDPHGRKITDRKQAIAVAFSEGRRALKTGLARRTFKGRTRLRPKKKKR